MTLRLVIEHANHPQRVQQLVHPQGELSIGRGAECGWQIEDPDMYVSRKHCVISGGPGVDAAGRWFVTDASRGGLFIDGKDQALGPGNTTPLENGMRLRLGDVVIRVEVAAQTAAAVPRPAQPAARSMLEGDGFFTTPVAPPPEVRRPEGLPQPFETARAAAASPPAQARSSTPPPMFDDPFTLDASTPRSPAPPPAQPARPAPLFADPFASASNPASPPAPSTAQPAEDFSFGNFFDEPARPAKPATSPASAPSSDDWGMPMTPAPVVERAPAPAGPDDWGLSPTLDQPTPPPREPPAAVPPTPEPPASPSATPEPLQSDPDRVRERIPTAPPEEAPAPAAVPPSPAPPPTPSPAAPSPTAPPEAASPKPEPEPEPKRAPPHSAEPGADLHAAFLNGMGLDPAKFAEAADPAAMEAMGKRFRMLVEGLVNLLRTRAREKQNVRVAQTIIGSADVNPLKFLATTDDALAALIAPRGAGYLKPDEAINAAFRDLADHQMRTWVGMQSALRQMIDRFDPGVLEREMEETGLMAALLAGGRSAKLWQLYNDRYRDIARSAEDRFLGEVGADFRDAYEGNRRKKDDPKT